MNNILDFTFPKPPSIFVGREKELNRLIKGFDSQNVILIDGIAGIGKTSLALSLACSIDKFHNGNICWMACKEEWSLENFFYEINRWLKCREEYLFEQCLEDTRMDLDERILYLIDILNRQSCVIFIDDYQKLKSSDGIILIQRFVEYLKNSKVIILSRERPKVSPLCWLEIFEQKLYGLDNSDATLLIKQLVELHEQTDILEQRLLNDFNRITHGHPFLIKTLLCTMFFGERTVSDLLNDPSSFIESNEDYLAQVITTLNEKEKELLFSFSIFRMPVYREAFHYVCREQNLDSLINSLQQKFLLNRYSENTYLIHDLLRHFCDSHLSEDRKALVHRQCAFYYESITDSEKKLIYSKEAFYHFVQSGDIEKSVEILENIMYEMMMYLQLRELELYIDKIPQENRSVKLDLMKADLLFMNEHYREAINLLEETEQETDSLLMAEIIILRAKCYMRLQNYKDAMELLDINLKNSDLSGDLLTYIKTLEVKGEINFELRHYEEALKCFEKALDINNKKIKNEDIEISLSLLTGMVMDRYGNLEEAHKIHLKSLKLAEKNNNFKEIPGLKLNIGWDYYQLGELDIAYEFLKEGLEIAHTDRLRIYSLYFTAMVYEEKGEDELAFSYFSKALEISKKLEDIEKQLIISTMMARLYVKIKKYKEAKQIIHENKYLLNETYSYIKRENLLILSEIELMEGNFKESLILAYHVLEEARRDVDVFQLFIASYLMSLLSEEDDERIKWRNEARTLLDKLCGHEKRKAMKYFASLEKFLVKELDSIPTKTNGENYWIKLGKKEYYADFAEVEKLKSHMSSFELFIDLSGGTVWEHTGGFIDFSRKRNLASLLFYFVRNGGKCFTLEELYSAIWKSKFYKNDGSTVKTSISRLRKLLEPEPEKPKYIKIFSLPYQKESKYYFSEDVNFCFIEKVE